MIFSSKFHVIRGGGASGQQTSEFADSVNRVRTTLWLLWPFELVSLTVVIAGGLSRNGIKVTFGLDMGTQGCANGRLDVL